MNVVVLLVKACSLKIAQIQFSHLKCQPLPASPPVPFQADGETIRRLRPSLASSAGGPKIVRCIIEKVSHPRSHSPESSLRAARPGDVGAILGIELVSFVHAGERFGKRRVRYLIGSPRVLVTVAELESRVLGWAAGLVRARAKEPWGRIYALAVHPEARGRRLGSQLLQHMINALRQRGAGRIFLEVRPDNHAALRLYERFGFVPCRNLPDYYGHGHAAQRMVLAG